jgi:hypothetical protein
LLAWAALNTSFRKACVSDSWTSDLLCTYQILHTSCCYEAKQWPPNIHFVEHL